MVADREAGQLLSSGLDRAGPAPAGQFDRCRHRRDDPTWIEAAWPLARTLVIDAPGGGRVLVREGPDAGPAEVRLALIGSAGAPAGERLFLGVLPDGVPVFAVLAPLPAMPAARPRSIREIGHRLPAAEAELLNLAMALANWHAASPYSPVTGAPTTGTLGGWARTGPGDDLLRPRTDPAVIVLAHDGVAGPDGRCLLVHRASGALIDGRQQFSCVAGFVEAGESPERAAVREVAEEAGVTLRSPSYRGSQPWPFPGCLMLAFEGLADPREPVRIDPVEIAAAGWFTRRQLTAAFAGAPVESGHGTALALPPPVSLAWSLLRQWAH
ncbi:NAD(+) diphosphatase [Micromonospora sp. RTGN7]|uniref:NAD(+) diphosphatase n=1 Tax=Micromonospora sp. RTGN7 TaxID=3016526 RepID=UPI0029FF063A|nr:NUDIX domain-containing protein [Micromonospora sp. RTGN7]